MKNVFTGADPIGRRRAASAEPAGTEVLPEVAEPQPGPAFAPDPAPEPATEAIPEAHPEADPEPMDAGEEPFVPKSRYVMGRSTKVLVCVALVAGGMFAGSAVQKQIDAGTRAQRGTFGTVQNPGAGTGNGTGTATPGQGRRGGPAGSGTAGSGSAAGAGGAGASSTAPTPAGSK